MELFDPPYRSTTPRRWIAERGFPAGGPREDKDRAAQEEARLDAVNN